MKVKVLHDDRGRCAVVHVDSLVITASRDRGGYELLVEIDRDEDAAAVPVSIGTASGETVEWEL